jgi:hypothetical protein
MPALASLVSLCCNVDNWDYLINPAWIMFAIMFTIGALGLLALILLYPMSKD